MTIYLSERSSDFSKEYYYRALQELGDRDLWRAALEKWVRVFLKISHEKYIRIAAVDDHAQQLVAYVDIADGKEINRIIPEREDLFE